jgi:hypothetical protein
MGRNARYLFVLAGALGCPALALGQVATWNAPLAGTWNTAGNWTPAVVPNAATFDVFFNQALTGPYIATLDISVTERDLSVTHANATLDVTTRSITLGRNLLVNEGTITGSGGAITVGGTTTIRGNGSVRHVPLRTNGTLVIASDDGPVDIDDSDIDHEGAIATWAGPGQLRFNGGATLDIGTGATFTIGSTGNATWNSLGTAPFIINRGNLVKTSNTGTTIFTGPSLDNQGTVRVNLNSELRFVTPATLLNFSGGTLTDGTFNLLDRLRFDGAAISTLRSNVTLDGVAAEIVNGLGVNAFSGLSLIDAGATFTLRNGKSIITSGPVTIAGTLVLDTGASFGAGGSITVTGAGAILGSGTVSSGLTMSAGLISPGASPGQLNFIGTAGNAGNLIFQDGATLKMEIGGPIQGQQYDVLRISGFVAFPVPSGTRCDLRVINGFIPPIGSSYDIIQFQERTGQFSQFTGLRAGPQRRFVPQYLPDRLRVFVVFDECVGADFNEDGVVDFFDYLDFAGAFSNGDPAADFNGDEQVDFFDYLDFAETFDRCSG